jgi:hypothetical protein
LAEHRQQRQLRFESLIGAVSGSSYVFESFEASLQHDLNGDGVIGAPATVIEGRWIDQLG